MDGWDGKVEDGDGYRGIRDDGQVYTIDVLRWLIRLFFFFFDNKKVIWYRLYHVMLFLLSSLSSGFSFCGVAKILSILFWPPSLNFLELALQECLVLSTNNFFF